MEREEPWRSEMKGVMTDKAVEKVGEGEIGKGIWR